MNPYEELANAIVLLAAEDYRTARRRLRKNPKNIDARLEIESIEYFFRSRFYSLLTDIDGEFLIRMLREEK